MQPIHVIINLLSKRVFVLILKVTYCPLCFCGLKLYRVQCSMYYLLLLSMTLMENKLLDYE